MVFHWNLSDSKSPQVFSTLLSMLTDHDNAIVSIHPLIFKSSRPLTDPLGIVPSTLLLSLLFNFQFYFFVSYIPSPSLCTRLLGIFFSLNDNTLRSIWAVPQDTLFKFSYGLRMTNILFMCSSHSFLIIPGATTVTSTMVLLKAHRLFVFFNFFFHVFVLTYFVALLDWFVIIYLHGNIN